MGHTLEGLKVESGALQCIRDLGVDPMWYDRVVLREMSETGVGLRRPGCYPG